MIIYDIDGFAHILEGNKFIFYEENVWGKFSVNILYMELNLSYVLKCNLETEKEARQYIVEKTTKFQQ